MPGRARRYLSSTSMVRRGRRFESVRGLAVSRMVFGVAGSIVWRQWVEIPVLETGWKRDQFSPFRGSLPRLGVRTLDGVSWRRLMKSRAKEAESPLTASPTNGDARRRSRSSRASCGASEF